MKTVIVPTNFSETSLNAAKYAVQFLTGQYDVNLILHHVYPKSGDAEESVKKLEELKTLLLQTGIVKINTLAEEGSDFITELEILVRHRQADLVIMGIAERTVIGQSLLGSKALKMLNTKVCPVLIVPLGVSYHNVKNVLLTSDFKNVMASTPSVPIRNFLKMSHSKLHIVNIDSEHYVAITEEYQAEKTQLNQMFHDFHPEFYFLGLNDVDEAINQFAMDKNIDIIVIIHKDQNVLSKLFMKSHTKKLAFQSNIPVLVVHE